MLTVDGAETGVLFVGDDWAEDHHDIELQDGSGRVLRTARVPEGVAGMARFHELIATFLPDDADPAQVLVCIETDRGPWVRALVAAGYRVFGVNPKQAARHREVVSLSGAKSDKADAHTLADMVRTRRHHLRAVAADSDEAEAVKVVARAHQTLIWERTRHMLRLRAALRDYFPAALEAYKPLGLTGADTLELLAKAPTPAAAAKLTATQIGVALKRARRRDADAKSRKNCAGTSPITRQSGKSKTVHARFIHNDRLVDALHMQASAAILHDPHGRAYYDELRGREIEHNAALRQLANRRVGLLHGCLKTGTLYDPETAWSHRAQPRAA